MRRVSCVAEEVTNDENRSLCTTNTPVFEKSGFHVDLSFIRRHSTRRTLLTLASSFFVLSTNSCCSRLSSSRCRTACGIPSTFETLPAIRTAARQIVPWYTLRKTFTHMKGIYFNLIHSDEPFDIKTSSHRLSGGHFLLAERYSSDVESKFDTFLASRSGSTHLCLL